MEVLPRDVFPPGIGGVGFGSSPNLTTVYIISVLCQPSERGMGLSMLLVQFQSRVGSTVGRACPRLQLRTLL